MKLLKFKIKNYRNYTAENEIIFGSEFTSIIGKNDAGKSTIFDALDIFFNNGKPDLEDLNVNSSDKEISFSCVFSNFPEMVTIDATAQTKLNEEFLLNEEDYYEVVKKFKCTDKTIASTPEIFIRAMHPADEGFNDLHTLKIDALKSRGQEFGVEADDKRESNAWRKAIWNSNNSMHLELIDLKVDDFDSKAKSIHKNLENHYPIYALFKSDRETSDSDNEAKDPIQLAVKEAQKEYETEIDNLRAKIQERVENVTKRALDKLMEMDASLASQLKPVLKSIPKWAFDYKIEDERGVSINKRGSGARRLVLLNFFRAEAERKSLQSEGDIIYAVEEPETSQHPSNQRMLISSLLALSKDAKRQVFITTHSPELLQSVPEDSICFINSQDDNLVIAYGKQGLILAADSLGILSDQKFGGAKIIILVEAMADCLFLEHAAKKLKEKGTIAKDFQDANILTLPLGGCSGIRVWIENNKAEDLGLKYAVFMDSDRTQDNTTDPALTVNENHCDTWSRAGTIAHATKKREIENYIDTALVGCTYGDYDDAKILISTTNGISQRKVIETYWPLMTAEQIESASQYTDNHGNTFVEISDFISKILSL